MNQVQIVKIIVDTVVETVVHIGRTNGWDGNTTAEWCASMGFAEKLVNTFIPPETDQVLRLTFEVIIENYLNRRITDAMAEVVVIIIL
jgi:hypothetical protein